MGACGGNYTTNSGTIYSSRFPGCYHNKSNCSWSITTVEDHVSLDFTIFDFSDESFQVIITEKYNGSVTVLGQYNKTSPPTSTIYSRSKKAIITLYEIKEGNGCDVFAIDFSGQVRCEVPDEVDNGWADTDSICPYCSGGVVTVVCDPGYVINSTYSSVECHNGEWNALLPQCMAADKSAYPSTSIIMLEKTDSFKTTQDTGSGLSSQVLILVLSLALPYSLYL
ncbi:kremen protein 2-like [Ptychodera flava]|uniref:kremen protein 2-like n=1 Tax=Ptychodera flava TaxID=63121 RepID=UPI00396AA8FD